MMNELLSMVKQAAVEAVDSAVPCGVTFGSVEQVSPWRIRLEQRLLLGEKQLVCLCGPWDNEAAVGDRVVLLRLQGGQKYLILGRLEEKT